MQTKWLGSLATTGFRNLTKSFGLFLVIAATCAVAQAAPPLPQQTPEIDPSAISGALALLASGVFWIKGRRHSNIGAAN